MNAAAVRRQLHRCRILYSKRHQVLTGGIAYPLALYGFSLQIL
jgi:hypothetical protein